MECGGVGVVLCFADGRPLSLFLLIIWLLCNIIFMEIHVILFFPLCVVFSFGKWLIFLSAFLHHDVADWWWLGGGTADGVLFCSGLVKQHTNTHSVSQSPRIFTFLEESCKINFPFFFIFYYCYSHFHFHFSLLPFIHSSSFHFHFSHEILVIRFRGTKFCYLGNHGQTYMYVKT